MPTSTFEIQLTRWDEQGHYRRIVESFDTAVEYSVEGRQLGRVLGEFHVDADHATTVLAGALDAVAQRDFEAMGDVEDASVDWSEFEDQASLVLVKARRKLFDAAREYLVTLRDVMDGKTY